MYKCPLCEEMWHADESYAKACSKCESWLCPRCSSEQERKYGQVICLHANEDNECLYECSRNGCPDNHQELVRCDTCTKVDDKDLLEFILEKYNINKEMETNEINDSR